MDKSENPTTYIPDSDAIMDMEDAYNKITSLYLGEEESQIEHLPHDIKVKLTDKLAKKNFEKNIIEKFYDHQVNDKQKINKSALDVIVLSKGRLISLKIKLKVQMTICAPLYQLLNI